MKFTRVIVKSKYREEAKKWCTEQMGSSCTPLKKPLWWCKPVDVDESVDGWEFGFYFRNSEHATMFKLRFGETVC